MLAKEERRADVVAAVVVEDQEAEVGLNNNLFKSRNRINLHSKQKNPLYFRKKIQKSWTFFSEFRGKLIFLAIKFSIRYQLEL